MAMLYSTFGKTEKGAALGEAMIKSCFGYDPAGKIVDLAVGGPS